MLKVNTVIWYWLLNIVYSLNKYSDKVLLIKDSCVGSGTHRTLFKVNKVT